MDLIDEFNWTVQYNKTAAQKDRDRQRNFLNVETWKRIKSNISVLIYIKQYE